MSGHLVLADGRTVPVRNGLVIGRVAGCDLVLDDHKASRRHARIVVESGVVEIEDLGSSNGTLLNGKPVTRRVLREGDQVQIGTTVITFREGAAAPAPALPATPAQPAAAFADDDDLFGSATATTIGKPMPAPAPPAPAPPPARPEPIVTARPVPPPPPPIAPPPVAPPPPSPAVVEFADEVVEVRKASPPAAQKAPAGAAPEPAIRTQQRVLQFSKHSGSGGVLGEDVGQMSGGTRSLIFAGVLAGAALVAWLIMRAVG